MAGTQVLEQRYRAREARSWLRRALEPPVPFVMNWREARDFPLGKWNLYIGGAGRSVPGYINLDLFPMPGVNVAADAEQLPFPDAIFQRVECDAVLEHVCDPLRVASELRRVLAPGG
ncbi:MAG: methyltransferase domain-containing protein, partial [Candidatus Solibacter sp.]